MAPIALQIDVGSGKGLRSALQVVMMRTMRMGYSSVLLRAVCLLLSGLSRDMAELSTSRSVALGAMHLACCSSRWVRCLAA